MVRHNSLPADVWYLCRVRYRRQKIIYQHMNIYSIVTKLLQFIFKYYTKLNILQKYYNISSADMKYYKTITDEILLLQYVISL